MGVGYEAAVDGVGYPAFESPDGFFGRFAFSHLLVVVVATFPGVSELGNGGDVEDVVEFAVPSRIEPMSGLVA